VCKASQVKGVFSMRISKERRPSMQEPGAKGKKKLRHWTTQSGIPHSMGVIILSVFLAKGASYTLARGCRLWERRASGGNGIGESGEL